MPIDMRSVPPPPKKAGSRSSARTTVVSNEPIETMADKRARGLNGLGQLLQGGFLMFGQYADAATVGTHFPPVAREVANIADSNDYIAKGVDVLIELGPYSGLIAAVLPMALQFMANHRMIDATRMFSQGVVPPEVLDAQMRARVTQMQAEAMLAQKEALRAAQDAQKAMDEMYAEAQAA